MLAHNVTRLHLLAFLALAMPFDATRPRTTDEAQTAQQAWAKQLGVKVIEKNSVGMEMVLIPPGKFTMGSPVGEAGRGEHEDQIMVTLTQTLYVGKIEVTQGQWQAVMSTQPWKGKSFVKEGADYPATYVSWEDAEAFCAKLSRKEGVKYRLLTEAEWEYACRAGTMTRYAFGDDESQLGQFAWFSENAYEINERYAHQVGLKKANPFGLHEMHGNVWEWCQDWYAINLPGGENPSVLVRASLRVSRGGGWEYSAFFCRSADRHGSSPDDRNNYLGFRVARVPSDK